ncbi:MAG: hypothetical protein H7A49_08815 [Akkermansiaceae bacterium]|nr:hypothetical protein [Akkermansiaceae bacterium]MCP5543994.1 hypothetical protein [Akkermansiaceae bacterium]
MLEEPTSAPAGAAAGQSAHEPIPLKPEPRALPQRPHPSEPLGRQISGTAGHGGTVPKPAPLGRHPKRKGAFARFLMLGLFLLCSAALVYGVLTILKNKDKEDGGTPPANSQPLPPPQSADPGAPTSQVPPETSTRDIPDASGADVIPMPPADLPEIASPVEEPELPAGIEPRSPAIVAGEVLHDFLEARTLEERLPIIETKTQPEELAKTCLAGPLPTVEGTPHPEFQESNSLEDVVDVYFSVDFQMPDGGKSPQTVLVRTRGSAPPKVVADPFLDLFGGRLEAYATHPTEDAGEFQVIVYAVASCSDPNVPDREKKLTLKLLAREDTKEIARAYANRVSKIGEMLRDGTYSLSWGSSKACTVLLAWNTTDNPEHPFLEAISIKALDWNP